MSQRSRLFLASTVLAASAVSFAAGALFAQEGGTPTAMSEAEAMKRMMEVATPGPEHAELAKRVGTWQQTHKMRMGPDAPWMETAGTSQVKPMLGGRYVMEEVQFDFMGMPFQGVQILGYDQMKKAYISLWMDSMSTWWVTTRGKADANGVVEMKGTMVDIAGERPFRVVVTPKGADELAVEMYDTIPPQGEVLTMSYVSKRKP